MCEPCGKKYNNWQHRPETVLNSEAGEKKNTSTLKIRIPRDIRESLREQLDLVGINRAGFFPDLGSVARYLAWAVHRRKRP